MKDDREILDETGIDIQFLRVARSIRSRKKNEAKYQSLSFDFTVMDCIRLLYDVNIHPNEVHRYDSGYMLVRKDCSIGFVAENLEFVQSKNYKMPKRGPDKKKRSAYKPRKGDEEIMDEMFIDESFLRGARRLMTAKKGNAKQKGIDFHLLLKDFIDILFDAGIHPRDVGRREYVLLRKNNNFGFIYGNCEYIRYEDMYRKIEEASNRLTLQEKIDRSFMN